MENSIDLHIHTAASDGSDTAMQLLEKLRRENIDTFSITDHDTMDAVPEMAALAPDFMHYIPGVELPCITPFRKCHILGYGFDPRDSVLRELLLRGRNLRREKQSRRIAMLETKYGIYLTEAEINRLFSKPCPGKPHLGEILAERKLAPDSGSAIEKYLNFPSEINDRLDAQKAIQAILHAGGIPVWAHPLGGEGEKRLSREQFTEQLQLLVDYGIRGLECYYSRYSQDDISFLTLQAGHYGLLVSGGSDYHGDNKKGIHLGQLNKDGMAIQPAALTILTQFPK